LSCLVLSCLVLSCLVLSCLALSCLVLSCLVLFVSFCLDSYHVHRCQSLSRVHRLQYPQGELAAKTEDEDKDKAGDEKDKVNTTRQSRDDKNNVNCGQTLSRIGSLLRRALGS
jgi:hypothetical protein